MALELSKRLKAWYRGVYVPPPPPNYDSGVLFVELGHHRRPRLAIVLESVGGFLAKHWQFFTSTIVAIVLGVAAIVFQK